MQSKSNIQIIGLLDKIFDNSSNFLKVIAPSGWIHSEYVHFLHPTVDQQYKEVKEMTERLNKLTKEVKEVDSLADYQQDDLSEISEEEEFRYVLGLTVYDIFSDNHEVYDINDKSVYDLGSFRGSGRLLANFLNNKYFIGREKYNYIDFYMGTIWIKDRANLILFYEFIFKVLQSENCDWNYTFPRLFLLDLNVDKNDNVDNSKTYKPEEAMGHELDRKRKEKEFEEFQNDLDSSYEKEYENAQYEPLTPIVEAYKTIYEKLPNGHPQKQFE